MTGHRDEDGDLKETSDRRDWEETKRYSLFAVCLSVSGPGPWSFPVT